MRLFALVAAMLLALVPLASAADLPAAPVVDSPYRVGLSLAYELTGNVSQAVSGHDALGQRIDQGWLPTNLIGSETITIQQLTAPGMVVKRTGTIRASVRGGRPEGRTGIGWSTISDAGVVMRDDSKLGGVFLLPLAFLGDRAVKLGDELHVGDAWSAKLGTKLFGMTARPTLRFVVESVSNASPATPVYTIVAHGSAPLREPVIVGAGRALGWATGTTHLEIRFEYDRANLRVSSMRLHLYDTLKFGSAHGARGWVNDRQSYHVSLRADSTPASTDGANAPAGGG